MKLYHKKRKCFPIQRLSPDRPPACPAGSCHRFIFPSVVLFFFLLALCGKSAFASIDIYVYKDKTGQLTFTSVPAHEAYNRLIRIERLPENKSLSSPANSKNAVVQLFRDKDTGDIGYLDDESFIPLWPDSYITLNNHNMAFGTPDEYEDIWVVGLSEQVGPIKMRRGLPLSVTVTAIDWLIERNLDKYKAKITSKSNKVRWNVVFLVFGVILASLPVIIGKNRYKQLATAVCLTGAAMYDYAVANRHRIAFPLIRWLKDHRDTLARLFVFIREVIGKYALGECCCYCKEYTKNDVRICDECQMQTEKAKCRAHETKDQEGGPATEDAGDCTTKENRFDPYEILRLTREANKEEIRAAYFNLIKQYHPDRVSHLGHEFQKLAEEKAQQINRAYELLMAN